MKKLRDADPFQQLPDEAFALIEAAATLKKFPEGSYVFQQKDPPTGFLYIVREGLVEITTLTPGGADMVVDYRKEGQFFGGTPVFTQEAYSGGARTVKPTECFLIPYQILRDTTRSHPSVAEHFNAIVISRVRRLYTEIVSDHTQNALTQMEAYPFKKRLSEIMSSPVEMCDEEDSAQQVARRMTDKRISAVLVKSKDRQSIGIITERDLVSKVIVPDDVDCKTVVARQIMTPHPYSMSPDTYMYEAMAYMLGHHLKHMPIVHRGDVVGIVTLQDLMRYRSQKAMLLLGSIREETTLPGLAAIRREIVTVARTLLSETRSTPEVMEIITYIHHGIMKRVYELTQAAVAAEGLTQPNIRHAFLIMGSGGRREMLLGPDQDNGLIYEDVPDERMVEVEAYFVPFSERLVHALAEVGYPLCDGKVMANNPVWRGRLSDWRQRVRKWINSPDPQNVLNSTIFFDFTTLVGDPSLSHKLRQFVNEEIRRFPLFLYHLMTLDYKHKAPVGLLGRFILEKDGKHDGQISLKQSGLVFIVDCMRMFALEKELQELTTLDRLRMLVKKNVFEADTAEHIRAAFESLVFLRLRNEIELVEEGREPSHYLDPYALSKNEQDLLKESFHAVNKLQDSARRHFTKSPF
jgi:CBS domain-containing protein